MSVEKDQSWLAKESNGFTMINNDIINHMYFPAAYEVWSYLYSKTENWIVNKKHIAKYFGYGESKIKRIFAFLTDTGLLAHRVLKDKEGKFIRHETVVKVGKDFLGRLKSSTNPDAKASYKKYTKNRSLLDIEKSSKIETVSEENTIESIDSSIGLKSHPVAKTPPLLNKYNNKYTKEISLVDQGADDSSKIAFDDFWANYPRKEGNKPKTKNVWDKLPIETQRLVLQDIAKRKLESAQWQNKKFIPFPSTYLNGERWGNEIVPDQPSQEQRTQYQKPQQPTPRRYKEVHEIFPDKPLPRSNMPDGWRPSDLINPQLYKNKNNQG